MRRNSLKATVGAHAWRAAVLGAVADRQGVEFVYRVCAFLPLLGLVAALLPDIERPAARSDA